MLYHCLLEKGVCYMKIGAIPIIKNIRPIAAAGMLAVSVAVAPSCVKLTMVPDESVDLLDVKSIQTPPKQKAYPFDMVNEMAYDMGALTEEQHLNNVPSVTFNDKNNNNHYLRYNYLMNYRNPDTLLLERLVINPDHTGQKDTLKMYVANDILNVNSSDENINGLGFAKGDNGVWNEVRDGKVVAQWYLTEAKTFVRDSSGILKTYSNAGTSEVPNEITFNPIINSWQDVNAEKINI